MDALSALSMPNPATLGSIASGGSKTPKGLAEEFEAVFLNTLFQSMEPEEDKDSPFSGGAGERVWRGMFNDAVAQQVAQRGGIGIASSVYQQILKLQEQAPHEPR